MRAYLTLVRYALTVVALTVVAYLGGVSCACMSNLVRYARL